MPKLVVLDMEEFRSRDDRTRRAFADKLGRALNEVGYLILSNPGLPDGAIARGFEVATRFFALPAEVKQACTVPESRGMRGYVVGDPNESYGKGEAPTEMWHMGIEPSPLPPNYFPNAWPELPGFRADCEALFAALAVCASEVFEAYTLHLAADALLGRELLRDSWSVMRAMRYPPWSVDRPRDVFRASPHVDVTLLSLYTGGSTEGLEFQNASGRWEPIAADSAGLLVGAGEVFEIMSLGLVKPTMHRVAYPPGAPRARFALPFFSIPRPSLRLDALAVHARAHGGHLEPPPFTVGELVARRAGWGADADTQPREHRRGPEMQARRLSR